VVRGPRPAARCRATRRSGADQERDGAARAHAATLRAAPHLVHLGLRARVRLGNERDRHLCRRGKWYDPILQRRNDLHPQTSNTTVQLSAVGGSPGDVYAVGGNGGGSTTNTILHTTNAGMTWTPQTPVSATSVSAGVWAPAAMTAFVTSYAAAGLIKTSNGGGTGPPPRPIRPRRTTSTSPAGRRPARWWRTTTARQSRQWRRPRRSAMALPPSGGTSATDIYAVGSAGTIAHRR